LFNGWVEPAGSSLITAKPVQPVINGLFRQGENHIGRFFDVWMLGIVNDLQLPGPFFALHPLAADQRCLGIIFVVIFDGAHNRIQLRGCDGGSQLFLVQRLCTGQRIIRNLKTRILKTNRLRPFLAGLLGPGIAEIRGTLTGQ